MDERFYKAFFEHHPDGIFSFDLQGNLTHVNPVAESMCGYTAEDVKKLSIQTLIPPECIERGLRYFKNTVKGKSLEFEIKIRHKHGHRIEVNVKTFPIFIDHAIVGVYGTMKCVTTKYKEMEEDLKSTREQLNIFLKNTVDSIIILDLQFHVLKVNQAFERMFGWTEQEVIGGPKPTVPDFLKDEFKTLSHEIINGRHITSFETVRQHKNGTLIDVSIYISPILDSKRSVSAFVFVLRDISESKRMEEALKESEMKYRVLFEQAPDAVYLIELNENQAPSRYLEVNRIGCERFGYSREQLLSMSLTDVVPEDSTLYMQVMEKIREGKRSFTLQEDHVFKQGKKMNLELSFQSFNLGGKEVFLVISRDITKRLKTEELLRKSEKLAVVGHLATAIAHEVNNPLTAIKGLVELVKSKENDNNQRYIEIVLSEINRIEDITNQFMAIAKPQAVKSQSNDIYKIIKQVTYLFQSQVTINNVQILTDLESGIPLIPFERNQLKIVFINLLKNAIASMPMGGEVLIKAIKFDDQKVCISIIDKGCGIAKERMPYLGEPFYSIREEGIGLGLMICFKIIEAHGGELCIESEEGKGTKVDVILPTFASKN